MRAGVVTAADLGELYAETGLTAFVGVRAGDHLIYIAEAGSDLMASFEARTNIRRALLTTAGGKALLSALPPSDLETFVRQRPESDRPHVQALLRTIPEIRASGIAINTNDVSGRTGIATLVHDHVGRAVAAVTLVGASRDVLPRVDELSALLLRRVESWRTRRGGESREPL
ncbi:IclR family transcriptional regulator C-terminal domain-containing protein [Microbacterium sp. X-17]|uniref:IclR family transcriptional regulator domain-containing protein n=1 Tax=Microbacterium sp. X-17 TaxID=3144404 RepID=UPI0031F53DB5